MPELPEVEVTRRRISPLLLGRSIRTVITTAPSYVFLTAPHLLEQKLTGRTFVALTRHGKYLLGQLDDGARLLVHLGMTGQLFGEGASSPRLLRRTANGTLGSCRQFEPDAHTHLILRFESGPAVFFRDTRKFGKVQWLAPDESSARLNKLGPDALHISGATLHSRLKKRRGPLKSQLLDQSVLAGAGNIYADEALYLSRIRPTRMAHRVSLDSCRRLVDSLQQVLLRSIETGGSSINDYVTPDGSDGGYQDERHVYGLEGQPCKTCSTAIARVVIGQRSAHYCPRCQR